MITGTLQPPIPGPKMLWSTKPAISFYRLLVEVRGEQRNLVETQRGSNSNLVCDCSIELVTKLNQSSIEA